MVNAPLDRIREECLLWQVDSDELWTTEQFLTARDLFRTHPDKTAAFYFCHYFVGEQLVITTRDTYGNHRGYEWIRTWRFTPGCRWTAHEPPRLCRPSGQERRDDLAAVNPFHHGETETAGLIFSTSPMPPPSNSSSRKPITATPTPSANGAASSARRASRLP